MGLDLSQFNQARVAVVLEGVSRPVLCRGEAHYERDASLGNILRIWMDDGATSGACLIVAERGWDGRVVPDSEFGCDYRFIPRESSSAAQ